MLGLFQIRKCLLNHEEGALGIDGHGAVEVLLGHIKHPGLGQDAGIVHHNVNAAQFFRALLHGPGNVLRAAYIALGAKAVLQLRGCRADLFLIDVQHGHPAPLFIEALGNGISQSLGSPGHNRPSVLQLHLCTSCYVQYAMSLF